MGATVKLEPPADPGTDHEHSEPTSEELSENPLRRERDGTLPSYWRQSPAAA
jgi:hypothetical protein